MEMETLETLAVDEEEEKEKDIGKQISDVLDKLPPEQRSTTVEAQNEALNSLDEDFIIGLKAHIYNVIRTEGEREKGGKSNKMNEFRENPEKFIK